MIYRSNPVITSHGALMPDIGAIMQSSNLYVYCVNNPVNFIDPTGMKMEETKNYAVPGVKNATVTKVYFTNLKITVYTTDGKTFHNSAYSAYYGGTVSINDPTGLGGKGSASQLSYVTVMDKEFGAQKFSKYTSGYIGLVSDMFFAGNVAQIVGSPVKAISNAGNAVTAVNAGAVGMDALGNKSAGKLIGLIPIYGTWMSFGEAGAMSMGYKPTYTTVTPAQLPESQLPAQTFGPPSVRQDKPVTNADMSRVYAPPSVRSGR